MISLNAFTNILVSNIFNTLLEKYKESTNNYFNDSPPDLSNKYPINLLDEHGFYEKVIIDGTKDKVCIIGDIHSSLHSFIAILQKIKDDYFIKDAWKEHLKQRCLYPSNYFQLGYEF